MLQYRTQFVQDVNKWDGILDRSFEMRYPRILSQCYLNADSNKYVYFDSLSCFIVRSMHVTVSGLEAMVSDTAAFAMMIDYADSLAPEWAHAKIKYASLLFHFLIKLQQYNIVALLL